MIVEVWRLHPSNKKIYSEVEHFNANHYMIHPMYYKKIVDLDLSKFVVLREQHVAADGWFAKTVQELFDKNSQEPGIFMRTPEIKRLVDLGYLRLI